MAEAPKPHNDPALAYVEGQRPSDFLRARRPERFSDTPKTGRKVLPRDLLEYKLATLTSRKQEGDFEEYARKLAERELCPNLLPQTGPTGGGDSKTDASTYPVAPALAERWYRGSPNSPSTEYWAFAFRTKEKWKDKLSEDIEKIAALQPRPEITYFVTSQFARDKERGDKGMLVKETGEEVKIVNVSTDPHTGRIRHQFRGRHTFEVGERVTCRVDWRSRFRLMQRHTGNHLLYGCAKKILDVGFPAVSKTTLGDTYTKWLGQGQLVNAAVIGDVFAMANAIISEKRVVIVETMPRAAALSLCGQYHEAVLPRSATELRIVVVEYGEKIAEGPAAAIQGNPRVIEAYLGVEDEEEA